MKRYTPDEELRIRLQRSVREWTRSGLLTDQQRILLEPELAVDLRRTNVMLRLGLAVFTLIAAGAAALLVFVTFEPNREGAIAFMCLLLGAGALVIADVLVARFRLYRYGVEEALAGLAVLLFGIGAAFGSALVIGVSHDSVAFAVALLTCAGVSAAAYVCFGFQYAAVASIVFAATVPLAFDAGSRSVRRLAVCALFLCAYAIARRISNAPADLEVHPSGQRDDGARDDATMVAACAIVAAYVVVNVHAGIDGLGIWGAAAVEPWFKWTTYALTWLIPVFAVLRGIADRDRRVMRAGMVTLLVTLITNKPYLGWPRQTWDPMLLGAVLIAAAVFARRWLAGGPGGERHGFTPVRILQGDVDALRIANLASVGIHPGAGAHRPAPAPSEPDVFGGGRSGGGGASGDL